MSCFPSEGTVYDGASSAISRALMFIYIECTNASPKTQRGVKSTLQVLSSQLQISPRFPSIPKVSPNSFSLGTTSAFVAVFAALLVCSCSTFLAYCCLWHAIKQKSNAVKWNQLLCFIKLHVTPLWPVLCSSYSLGLLLWTPVTCLYLYNEWPLYIYHVWLTVSNYIHQLYTGQKPQKSRTDDGAESLLHTWAWSKRTSLFASH